MSCETRAMRAGVERMRDVGSIGFLFSRDLLTDIGSIEDPSELMCKKAVCQAQRACESV
jgi:hypothetical protein